MDPRLRTLATQILASASPSAALLDALLAYGTPDPVNPDVRRQDRELIEAVLEQYVQNRLAEARASW